MAKIIEIEQFLASAESFPVVDVRAPGEFKEGHIPGAVNLPLFSDEERAVVGTYYKKNGQYKAMLSGLDFVGPKMSEFVRSAHKLAKQGVINVHCWRGGMRSQSMAHLFEFSGLKTNVLKGGYKAYRNYIKQEYGKAQKIFVLGGSTGSGKTEILYELEKLGQQIIDLEGLANHKGSAFGAIGENDQLPNEQFENNIYEFWKKLDLSKAIWIEDESKSIGKNYVPDELYQSIRSSKVIYLDVPKEIRVLRLIKDYAKYDVNLAEQAIIKIQKRLGNENARMCIEALKNKEFDKVADVSLNYYDKTYNFGVSKRDKETVFNVPTDTGEAKLNAIKVLDYVNNNFI